MVVNAPARRRLRVWPGVVVVILQWAIRFGLPAIDTGLIRFAIFGAFGGGLALLLWWLFFSRVSWSERLGAVGLMAVALVGTKRLVDQSIATGAMGFLLPMLAIPVLSLAFVAA